MGRGGEGRGEGGRAQQRHDNYSQLQQLRRSSSGKTPSDKNSIIVARVSVDGAIPLLASETGEVVSQDSHLEVKNESINQQLK